MTSTEKAHAILAELQSKFVAASDRQTGLATERRRVSFDAHSGDAKARKELDKLNAESATAGLEIENLHAAIDEAKRRLAEVDRLEVLAHQRQNAEAAKKLASRIAEHGRRADEAFAKVRVELSGLDKAINELHRLGLSNPRIEQVRVLGGIAISTWIQDLPIRAERGHLAPGEKKTFASLTELWSAQILRWCAPFIEAA